MASFLAPAPLGPSSHIIFVRDLMNSDGDNWHVPTLNTCFSPEIANVIAAIPLCSSPQTDCIQWKFTKDGQFSVKSAYWTAKKLKDVLSSIPSSSSNNPTPWKWIWQLKIPPKIKIFLWKCMRGILPTKTNLQRRGMDFDNTCTRCGLAPENLEHCLRDCEWNTVFWQASVLRLHPPCQNPTIPLQDWIIHTIDQQDSKFRELFGTLLWAAWKARNTLEFKQATLPHFEVFSMAYSMLADFQRMNFHSSPQKNHRIVKHWLPPPLSWIKLNSDASVGPDGATGLGAVLRDHTGSILNISSNSLPFCDDVQLAEALACRDGFSLAKSMGIRALVVEVDNVSLAHLLQRNIIPRSGVGSLVADILFFAQSFDHVSFCWASRSCNSLANEIARLARNSVFIFGVDDPLPVSIRQFAARDRSHVS